MRASKYFHPKQVAVLFSFVILRISFVPFVLKEVAFSVADSN